MNKQEFLNLLRQGLYGLPQDDIAERVNFYSEMIDDRIEEGFSEADAVAAAGSIDDIVFQVVSDIPLTKIVKTRTKSKKLKVWEIILLALGSPIWLSLLIAAFAIVLALYVSLWSVIISLWAVFMAFIGCAVGCAAGGVIFIFNGDVYAGIAAFAAGLVCAGLGVFMFYGCKYATKGILLLTKKIAVGIKNCFIKKR